MMTRPPVQSLSPEAICFPVSGSQPSAPLQLRQKAVFVLLENFSMLSFTGAADVLVTANLLRSSAIFDVETCSLHAGKVRSDLGVDVAVDTTLARLDLNNIGLLIICGGLRAQLKSNASLTALIKKCHANSVRIGGLWNGSYFLADAGLLQGLECTIHPDSRGLFKERFPGVSLSARTYLIHDRVFTCASPDSAIHAMLDTLEGMHSRQLKRQVNEILLANLDQPGTLPLAHKLEKLPDSLIEVITLMENNIEEVLGLAEISSYTGMSRRQIERLFNRYLDISPAKYYLGLRLERARQLVLKTRYTMSEISVATGFACTTHFSRSFKTYFDVSPSYLRWQWRDSDNLAQ